MSMRDILGLFRAALLAKFKAPPTRHQMPGKHHRVHAGEPGVAGDKLLRRFRRGHNVRGH